MIDYYDKIIVAVAGSLLGGAFLGLVTALAFETGLFVGTIVATLFVYDAIFRNPPVPTSDPRVAVTAVVWHVFLAGLLVTAFC